MRVERLSSIGDPLGGTMALRLQLWGAALRMALDHPLFGVGPDGFLYAYPAYREGVAWKEPFVSHPHNLILDYWLRGGIMGVAALGWLLAAWGRGVWRVLRKDGAAVPNAPPDGVRRSQLLALGLAGSLTAFVVHGLVDNSYFLPDLAYVCWASAGVLVCTHATHISLADYHADNGATILHAGEERLAMRVLVVGGAGMIGSHVCEMLLADDHEVWCLDSLLTGFRARASPALTDRPGFTFVNGDVSQALPADLPSMDWILHLASPASPLDFRRLSLEIMAVNARGTEHLLAFARQHGSRFLFASTSEVYGDPQEHPQRETYWGHVNPIGLRGCYDESKRYGEALTMAYGRRYDLDVRIVRIFNTYGPRTRHYDGRVVPNFICNAVADEPLVVIGTGEQTRSFCYVTDLAAGILQVIAAPDSAARGEVFNLGNPDEWTIGEFAALVDRGGRIAVSDHAAGCPRSRPVCGGTTPAGAVRTSPRPTRCWGGNRRCCCARGWRRRLLGFGPRAAPSMPGVRTAKSPRV